MSASIALGPLSSEFWSMLEYARADLEFDALDQWVDDAPDGLVQPEQRIEMSRLVSIHHELARATRSTSTYAVGKGRYRSYDCYDDDGDYSRF